MEAVGRLAGGVAHDFNNILTAIIGYSEMALPQASPESPLRRHLEEIKRAGERAAGLTRQLLAFGRRQVLQPQLLNLNTVVADATSILGRLIGENIELVSDLASPLGAVRADPGQLGQALINLALNARDAMPGSGTLTIATAILDLERPETHPDFTLAEGRYVTVSVSDTGTGMDPYTLGHIFEPFFTTKEPGKGTGLGLATVYGIIKQSEGFIAVESPPGGGSRFTIYLPRCAADLEPPPLEPAPAATPPLAGGSETVLVVDDEQVVRGLVTVMLEDLGYRVVQARSGDDALAQLARHPGPIQLLLTDIVMPGMSGLQLAERFRRQCPESRVLFMSGYSSDVSPGGLPSGEELLRKPFRQEELARRVHQALRETT
ncbi:MAG TPA: ATP-binding protein [Thermoanaerobaculia bacterium]|nr:ATP-binding protein [Thermoanaerobaculia bacterium]